LHPTPALGGDPRDLAMQVIAEAEPVPRGWYAAPVGWIDRNLDGQFTVAIRSAVAQEKRVWMYAGAGIVAESIPQKEWDETALKFRPMLDALAIKDKVNV
jgi:menaquinone-specific isochorismate synthase